MHAARVHTLSNALSVSRKDMSLIIFLLVSHQSSTHCPLPGSLMRAGFWPCMACMPMHAPGTE